MHLPHDSHSRSPAVTSEGIRINKRYLEIGAALLIIGALYLILSTFNLVPNIGVTDNMSYGFVFVIGLVAAMSTCLAVAGGLLLALAAKYNEAHPHLTGWAKFRPHAHFNIGRIAGYASFGALIGLLGSVLTLTPWMNGLVTLLAAGLMILVGLQLLQIFPALNRFSIKMPKRFAHKMYDSSTQNGPNSTRSFAYGALTFFLPCGFTQALQLYVLAQGSAVTGALTMLAFSLGTAPALLSIGAISALTKGSVQRYFTAFAAVLVIILGITNVPYGLALTGLTSASPDLPSAPAAITGEVQRVEMSVSGLDYSPSRFTIKQGVPVEWVISGEQAAGCAQILTAPQLGITERLSRTGPTTIRFTPTKTGFIPFHCSMAMTTPGAGFTVVA